MEITYMNGKKLDFDEKVTKNREQSNEDFEEESGTDLNPYLHERQFEKLCSKLPLALNFVTGKRSSGCSKESCPCRNDNTYYVSENLFYKTILFIFEDIIYHKKKRSTFFSQSSLRAGIGSVVTSHSNCWKFDAFQDNSRAIAYIKRLIFLQLGINVVNQPRLSTPEFMLSTPDNASAASLGIENSQVKFFQMKFDFSPTSSSTLSSQSVMLSYSSITKGQLQCLQADGMPYFIFSIEDIPQVTYMAKPEKIESLSEKAIDSLYSFYCRETKNSESKSNNLNALYSIAKMKVSSSIILKSNCIRAMETQFVLYGSHENISNELQNSASVVSKSKGFSEKVTGMLRASNLRKISSIDMVNQQKLDRRHAVNVSNLVDGLLPNFELVAIVVEECLQDTANDILVGGWGLKFLEKANQKRISLEPPLLPCCNENRDGSARSMNVLIPAGVHGVPFTQSGGVTSLINRWKSGGHCDCGGWDLGCPLRVLNYSSIYSNVSPKETKKKSLNLFMEGQRNRGQPTLRMIKISEDFYSIYFTSSLSALQTFSVAVAAVHSKFVEEKELI